LTRFSILKRSTIGASDVDVSVGYVIVPTRMGYTGKVYLLTFEPNFRVKPYPQLIRFEPLISNIATPAKTVPDVMEECGKGKVKGVIIVSAGFKETGPTGKALEEKTLEVAKKYGIRIIGPNCIGVIRPRNNLNATFLDKMPKQRSFSITESAARQS
jgi:acetyltransferase